MNIAGLRSIGFAVLLVLLAGAGCNRPKRASSESSPAPTPHEIRARITARARQMHSTICRRTCRTSLARYCGASRSKT
jgi:hypothetical protein